MPEAPDRYSDCFLMKSLCVISKDPVLWYLRGDQTRGLFDRALDCGVQGKIGPTALPQETIGVGPLRVPECEKRARYWLTWNY